MSVTALSESQTSPIDQQDLTENRGRANTSPLGRWWLVGAGLAFLTVSLAQSPRLIEDDTKLPVVMAPLKFIEGSLHISIAQVFGGSVDQTGLIFPMGFFFEICNLLHIPVWVAERLWLALLLTVGFWGFIRVAEALRIGTRGARVIGGVAFCVAPIVVTWAQTSADLLSVVLLPWVLLPLITGSRAGSPRRAAARSGVAIALMGGGNAVVIFATLPVALLWLATREKGVRRRQLTIWWITSVGLATFWWLASVALDGKYGFNYLPFTETSSVTTQTASAFEALRGASYWLDYYALKSPLIPGTWTLVSVPLIIVATATVAALGLAGLCRRIPERLFLVSCLTFGVVVIAIGYSGSLGGPFSHTVQHLLETKLAPLRNIAKFSADVSLPVTLGLVWCVSQPLRLQIRSSSAAQRSSQPKPFRSLATIGLVGVAITAVLLSAIPFWQADVYRHGGFASIPKYWTQAGNWLDAHQGNENAMLVPGSAFGTYTWGYPSDEPLQILTDTSVEWRNLIPLGSQGYIQMLDAVESVLDNGISTPGLADFLSRGGVKYVVERNDLNWQTAGAPPPAQVYQVLSETPGLKQVASFGPLIQASQAESSALPVYESSPSPPLRSVIIFDVSPQANEVRTYPASNPVIVSGDVSSLLPLAGAGLLEGTASILSGDPKSSGIDDAPDAVWAITDGNQLRYTGFGNIRYNNSYLLSAGQSLSTAAPDVPMSFRVVNGLKHETVANPIGAASVSSSSFGSSFLVASPNEGPAAAFDSDPSTAWVANAEKYSEGQWIQVNFDRPLALSRIALTPLRGARSQPEITQVTITTKQGSVQRNIPIREKTIQLQIPAGRSPYLRVTIDKVRPGSSPSKHGGIAVGAGIRTISLPGFRFVPRMKVPSDEASVFSAPNKNAPVISFSRQIANPNFVLGEQPLDDPEMGREFALSKPMQANITGYAIASPDGPYLEDLLQAMNKPSTPITVQATATSTLGGLPRFRPENTIDSDSNPWIAGLSDKNPRIRLSWKQPTVVSSISLELSSFASSPTEISLTDSANHAIFLAVPARGGVIHFNPTLTNSLTIGFTQVNHKVAATPSFGVEFTMPVGLAQVSIPGLIAPAELQPSQTFSLPCGQGPLITIDGSTVETKLEGTVGDLLNFTPIPVAACQPAAGISLSAGDHTLLSQRSNQSAFQFTSLLIAKTVASSTVRGTRTVTVRQWHPDSRSVSISAGPASILAIAQNYNTGWQAHLGLIPLKSVRVDGWQQGFVVPTGRGGTITIEMAPDRLFRAALLIGVAFLVLLAVLALLPSRRREPGDLKARRTPFWGTVLLASLFLVALIGGWLALAVIPLFFVARKLGSGWTALIAFCAFTVAGIQVALDPATVAQPGGGAFTATAQAASLIALAAVLSSLADREGACDDTPAGADLREPPIEQPGA